MNVHSPIQDAPAEEHEQFYMELESAVAAVPPGQGIIVAGDFNAWLGGWSSPGAQWRTRMHPLGTLAAT